MPSWHKCRRTAGNKFAKKKQHGKKKPGPESEIPGRPEGFVPAIAVPPREHALENRSPQQTQI
jgi:hypothetical protein